jgi:oxalate decarboxylase/phosphoglucose isomerase-like protein (cupin superfamily)
MMATTSPPTDLHLAAVVTAHTHGNADEFLYALKGKAGVGLGML